MQWNISQGAESYLVVATGTDGHMTKCNATALQCNLQALHCSTSYNISVIAVKQQCNTSKSSTVQIKTGTASYTIVPYLSFSLVYIDGISGKNKQTSVM